MTRAVVIGGGISGLAAAAVLSRQHRHVTLIEARSELGGTSAWHDMGHGFRVPGILHETPVPDPSVLTQLRISSPPTHPSAPIWLLGSKRILPEEPGSDLHRLRSDRIRPLIPALDRLLYGPPPALDARPSRMALGLMPVIWKLRRLGRDGMMAALRIPSMSLSDCLEESIDDPEVAGALALLSLVGTFGGPHNAGTALSLLLNPWMRGGSLEFAGGGPAWVEALRDNAVSRGVEILLGARASRIVVTDARVSGVERDGVTIPADRVVAAIDPVTAIDLLPPRALPSRDRSEALRFRQRGVVAKVHLAVDGAALPLRDTPWERGILAGTLHDLDGACRAQKYGEIPERPALDVRAWSTTVRGCGPPEHQVISVLIHGVPAARNAADSERRNTLLSRVLQRLAGVWPDLPDRIVHTEVLLPEDLEQRWNIRGGHLFHGELALDQLGPLRPASRMSGGKTPLSGFTLFGPGVHPGPWPPLAGVTRL